MPSKIAVIGAGISGICAAISASENGANVTIIEKSSQIGGVATKTNVGTFCGVFLTLDETPQIVGNEKVKSFLEEIIHLDDSHRPIEHMEGLHVIPYNFEIIQTFLNQKVKEHQINVLKNAVITSVSIENDFISYITILKNQEEKEYAFDAIIDCTGNAVIAKHINHPVLENKIYQSASRVFYMKGVAAQSEKTLRLYLSLAQQRVKNEALRKKLLLCSIVPGSYQKDQIGIKVNLPWDVKEIGANLSLYLAQSRALIHEISSWLTQDVEAFNSAHLFKIFDDIGFRSSARTLGQKVLTKADLRKNDMSDPAAIGAWPIEKWDFEGNVVLEMKEVVKNGYTIPKECLVSSEVKNLFMAGKNISADEDAIASARVMGTCIQTGFSAGEMASTFKNS